MTIVFEEEEGENQWTLGRDPETSDVVLEDPMVSRQHAIVRLTPEGFLLENLSTVNPATQNGMVIADPVLLKEGDIIQIGSTFFNYTEVPPVLSEEPAESPDEKEPEEEEASAEMASDLHFGPSPETRWLLKVISGPNAGAEFAMHRGATYLIGKDPNICDIVFQDLSVSRQHARLSVDKEQNVFVEDLGSRNGVIVNGELISEKQMVASQDLIALGTTTFLVIDRHEARETIISPPSMVPTAVPEKKEDREAARIAAKEKKDWKELVIPKKHLAIAGVFGGILFLSVFAMLSLFKTEPIEVVKVDHEGKINEVLERFPGVNFSYNAPSGKLFLTGHVTTTVDHQELSYLLKELPFITKMEDMVVVDELVWQSMNALVSKNPDWVGVSVYAPKPGQFVLRGYVETLDMAEALQDYINLNFDYLDRLANQVVIEKNLQIQLESLLQEKGFTAVTFELSNGEVVLAGRVDNREKRQFDTTLSELKMIPGIRVVKNFVVMSKGEHARVDLSKQFAVTGSAKRDDESFFVVINGRILGMGDMLEGMLITGVNPKMVLLERDGIKYKIDYNL